MLATPTDGYHALIHLRWQANVRAPQAVDAVAWLPEGEYESVRFKNLRPLRATRMPVVDFDPVAEYLHTLRVRVAHTSHTGERAKKRLTRGLNPFFRGQATYGHWALFLHDDCGGPYIAVVWKPAAALVGPFRARHAQDTMPADDGAAVRPNLKAILAGFERLGRGLVARIDVVSLP